MKIKHLFLLLICIQLSCVNSEKKTEEIKKTKFEQFVSRIPLLEIPFEQSSLDEFKHLQMESEFIPEGAALLGRLSSRDDKHLILYTYPADVRLPFLEVYSTNGKKINQLELYDYMNCDLDQGGNSKFTITNEFITKETYCNTYVSRVDRDTIAIEDLVIAK